MKRAVIAIEPLLANLRAAEKLSPNIDSYTQQIHALQERHVIPISSVVSIIHPGLFLAPISWYVQNEFRYASEVKSALERVCTGRFNFDAVRVLAGEDSTNQLMVELLDEYAGDVGSGLLVVLSTNKVGVPYWSIGSFAETAALTANLPVLVIKPNSPPAVKLKELRLLLAVDAAAAYTKGELDWLAELCKKTAPHVDLVHVKSIRGSFLNFLDNSTDPVTPDSVLDSFKEAVEPYTLSTSVHVLENSNSVAECITEFAKQRNSHLIITVAKHRNSLSRLLLGSTARKILSYSNRPFLNVQLGKK